MIWSIKLIKWGVTAARDYKAVIAVSLTGFAFAMVRPTFIIVMNMGLLLHFRKQII